MRPLLMALAFALALPFTFLRWLVDLLRRRTYVLRIDLDGTHPATPEPRSLLQRTRLTGIDRSALRAHLRRVTDDPRVAAVQVNIGALSGGWAELYELRAAIRMARAPGRQVVAFVTHADLRTLWVASAADEVWLPPDVPTHAVGLGAELTFYGEALDKLGLDLEVLTAGAFKSAMEPFTRREPSPASREAIDALLDDLYARVITDVAAARGIPVEAAQEALERGPQAPEDLVEGKIAHRVVPEEDVEAALEAGEDGPRVARALIDHPGRRRPWPRWRWRRPRLAEGGREQQRVHPDSPPSGQGQW